MNLMEGVGESSSLLRGVAGGGGVFYNFGADIFGRLLESGHEVVANPKWREQLHAHLSRLPPRVDVFIKRVEDVLVHHQLLEDAKEAEKRPAFHVRFVEVRSRHDDPRHHGAGVVCTVQDISDGDVDGDRRPFSTLSFHLLVTDNLGGLLVVWD